MLGSEHSDIGVSIFADEHRPTTAAIGERKRKFRRGLPVPPHRRTNAVKRHSEQKCLLSLSPCISRNIKHQNVQLTPPLLTRAAVSVESRWITVARGNIDQMTMTTSHRLDADADADAEDKSVYLVERRRIF